jgi:hypothetical protein
MSLATFDISSIKGMLARGDRQSDIAAWFGCNSGRVAEVSTGQTGPEIKAAPDYALPPAGPYVVVPKSLLDGLFETLRDLKERYREVE